MRCVSYSILRLKREAELSPQTEPFTSPPKDDDDDDGDGDDDGDELTLRLRMYYQRTLTVFCTDIGRISYVSWH